MNDHYVNEARVKMTKSKQQIFLLIGALAVLVSVSAWITDFASIVYPCPYCRIQRSIIGLLGLLILLGNNVNFLVARWLTICLGSYGFIIAVLQNFNSGWLLMFQDKFEFYTPIYLDSFLLSTCAALIISAEIVVLLEMTGFRRTAGSSIGVRT
ncbi:disulfide bond formation protein B [Pseudomonas putida group bacterium ESBL64]|uniref:disulfide bond formation protein B n=1 Tax=Pseudomonas putida group TaxID=136845 RepID=UPI0012D311A3